MNAQQIVAFVVFAIVAAITPGPSNVILTSTGATVGVIRGLPSLAGVAIGMGVMMFLVVFGLGSLLLQNEVIVQILKWCGAAFLLWLSWKIATAGRSEATTDKAQIGFWQLAAFQWVNPKSWLVCTSAAATYLQGQSGSALQQSLTLGVVFILAALPSCGVWLAFGAAIQRWLRTDRSLRLFNITMGVLLAGSILLIIL